MSKKERLSKDEIAAVVAGEFIKQLEAGTIPWRKGWSSDGIMPANFFSQRPYRGMNSLWLGMIQQARGYESPYWTTNRAAFKAGHFLKDGEKERWQFILLWKWLLVDDKKTGEKKRIPFLNTWTVYNTDQYESIVIPKVDREPVVVSDALKGIIDGYADGPRLEHVGQDRAYYSPASDLVSLPLLTQFHSEEAYAETLCHELTHSTGHPSRLKRFDLTWMERQDYAKEELVAEIGASMLMQHAGITPNLESMASYVGGWLSALNDDHNLIISAAQQAQKAADRITGYVYVAEEQDTTEKEQAA